MNSNTIKWLVLIFSILYIVSPVDGMVGPLDDIIVAVAGVITSGALSQKSKAELEDKKNKHNNENNGNNDNNDNDDDNYYY